MHLRLHWSASFAAVAVKFFETPPFRAFREVAYKVCSNGRSRFGIVSSLSVCRREQSAATGSSRAGEIVLSATGPDGEKTTDANELGAAVRRVLSDPACRQTAQTIAEFTRQYGGAKDAADLVEKFAADVRKL